MANKKIIFSVSASAFIAGSIFMAEEAEAAEHKVESGDSLWKIAAEYDTSVGKLKSLNGLSGDLIHPGQVIETSKDSSGSSSKSGSSQKKSSGSSGASGKTYTVKSGDTLSGIAHEYGVSLKKLMDWNDLDTTLIFPGNTFVVKKGDAGSSGSKSGSSKGSSGSKSSGGSGSSGSKAGTYTVKAGDSLSKIASNHRGVSVTNLRKWNDLSSDLLMIGQKLKLSSKGATGSSGGSSSKSSGAKGDSVSKPNAGDIDYNLDTLLDTAKTSIGTPYVWAGSSPGGFDCSGFIHYAYKSAGKDIARLSTDGYHSRAHYVENPKVGDLVFFENTYRAGISHMGIYVGNDEFIHAGSSGVVKANLNTSYWQKHFEGFKRFY